MTCKRWDSFHFQSHLAIRMFVCYDWQFMMVAQLEELSLGRYNRVFCLLLQLSTLQQTFDLHSFIICDVDKRLIHNVFSFTNFKRQCNKLDAFRYSMVLTTKPAARVVWLTVRCFWSAHSSMCRFIFSLRTSLIYS